MRDRSLPPVAAAGAVLCALAAACSGTDRTISFGSDEVDASTAPTHAGTIGTATTIAGDAGESAGAGSSTSLGTSGGSGGGSGAGTTTGGGVTSTSGAAAPMDAAAPPAPPPTCTGGTPDPSIAPATVDPGCFTSTFDDEFLAYDVSSGPLDDGMNPNEKWFNGTEQCCLAPSGGADGANYPTPGPDGKSLNPYSILPGGGLQIRLQKEQNTWMSGVMTSVDKNSNGFAQKYGYFEFDAKLAPGTGTWPGLWMLPTPVGGPGGEIDILEQYGLNPPLDPIAYTQFQMTIHDWTNAQPGAQFTAKGLPDLTADFHRFGLLWNSTYLALYVDGVKLWSTPTLDVMKRPYYLLADMGLGSGWDTSQTPSPSDLQIKYIRAYSVDGF